MAQINALMAMFDPDAVSAENMGVAVMGGVPFFSPALLQRLRLLPLYEYPHDSNRKPPPILIAVDPTASAGRRESNSEVGVTATAYIKSIGYLVSLIFR